MSATFLRRTELLGPSCEHYLQNFWKNVQFVRWIFEKKHMKLSDAIKTLKEIGHTI
jgi:hypothetical protein